MAFRATCERVLRTCLIELGGIVLVTPLYAWIYGASSHEGVLLLIVISLAVLVWALVYGRIFDTIEQMTSGRLASDRPHAV